MTNNLHHIPSTMPQCGTAHGVGLLPPHPLTNINTNAIICSPHGCRGTDAVYPHIRVAHSDYSHINIYVV